MGFYDVTCALSGLVLMGLPRSTVLVLRESVAGWEAVSPPIRGIYNRLGSLDLDTHPADVARWAHEMVQARATGRLRASAEAWEMAEESAARAFPPPPVGAEEVTRLLHLFDRTMVHASIGGFDMAVRLDDKLLGYQFFSTPVYDAVVANAGDVLAWSRDRGRPIAPLDMAEVSQHSLGQVPASLGEARSRFADVPWLLPVLKQLTIEHAKR